MGGRADGRTSAVPGDLTGLEPSDADLLAAHLAGDPEAFGALISRHRDRLWAVALRTLRHPEDAADALQDACLAAFRRADSFRGDAQVTTWLHRIVVNACLDRIRRNQVRAAAGPPEDLDRLTGQPAAADDPAVRRAQRVDVAAALATLPPDQRTALILVDVEGYSVAETAQILGCPPGTVKSRCARGRARLLPLLAHLRTAEEPSPASTAPPDDPIES